MTVLASWYRPCTWRTRWGRCCVGRYLHRCPHPVRAGGCWSCWIDQHSSWQLQSPWVKERCFHIQKTHNMVKAVASSHLGRMLQVSGQDTVRYRSAEEFLPKFRYSVHARLPLLYICTTWLPRRQQEEAVRFNLGPGDLSEQC